MRLIDKRYQLKRRLSKDETGSAYRALDKKEKKDVFLKLLDTIPGNMLGFDRRHFREFRALSQLEHTGIAPLYGFGHDQSFFYTGEYVPGKDIKNHFKIRRKGAKASSGYTDLNDPERLKGLMTVIPQVLSALQCMHEHHIVHRFLRPQSITIDKTDAGELRARITDLGFSRFIFEKDFADGQTGTMLPYYFSPEQAMGTSVDSRSDLYALGVILFELFGGKPPFNARNRLDLVYRHVYEDPPALRALNPDVHPRLEEAIHKLLNKDPYNRFQYAWELLEFFHAEVFKGKGKGERCGLAYPHHRTRLIGRSSEMRLLTDRVQRLYRGHPSVTVLRGDSGVGKTRLLQEIDKESRLKDLYILRAGCTEDSRGFCNLFTPVLDDCAAILNARSLAEAGKLLPRNARMLIRFSQAFEELPAMEAIPTPGQVPPDEDRLRSFQAVADLFRNLSREKPILLVLDDIQWADTPSQMLLWFILRNLASIEAKEILPFAVIAALRTDESEASSQLCFSIDSLIKDGLLTPLDIEGLDEREVGEVLRSTFSVSELPDKLATWVHGETGGNPFFIEAIVKELVSSGELCPNQKIWETEDGETACATIPEGIRELLSRRLERLTKVARKCLKVGAVIGREFSFDLVLDVLGVTEDELMDAVTELLKEKIICESPNGPDLYLFYHDKIREIVIDEMAEGKHKRLHGAVGESIEKLNASRLSLVYLDLAEHFDLAGRWDRALCYLPLVAARFKLKYETRTALHYYRRFIELYEGLDEKVKEESINVYLNVLLDMGDTYEVCCEYQPAIEVILKAMRIVEDSGDERLIADCSNRLARFLLKEGDKEKAMMLSKASHRRAKKIDHQRGVAEAEMTLGAVHTEQGEYDKALKWRKSSLTICRRLNFNWGISTNLQAIGAIRARQGRWRQALDSRLEGLDYATASGDRNRISQLQAMIGRTHAMLWDTSTAAGFLEKAMVMAEKVGNLRTLIGVHENLALLADFGNRFQLIEQHLLEARNLAESINDRTNLVRINLNMANFFVQTGRLQEARTWLSGLGFDLALPAELQYFRLLSTAQLYTAEGNFAESNDILEDAFDILRAQKGRAGIYEGLVVAAGNARMLGDREAMGRYLDEAGTERTDGITPEFSGRYLLLRLVWHAHDAGLNLVYEAHELSRKMNIPRLNYLAEFFLSTHYKRNGDTSRAVRHIKRAVDGLHRAAASLENLGDLYLKTAEAMELLGESACAPAEQVAQPAIT